MVKHIILWKLRSELSAAEKREKSIAIKAGLEGLKGQVPGLLDIHVQIDGVLETSNADIMLDSTLDSFESLKESERASIFRSINVCEDYNSYSGYGNGRN